MPLLLDAQVSEVIAGWESIEWRRVLLGGGSRADSRDVPDAREALAEDTLGGGMLRAFGPGNREKPVRGPFEYYVFFGAS